MNLDIDRRNQDLESAQRMDEASGFVSGAVENKVVNKPVFREVLAPKEFPGHPYSDEMLGNLILGPEYPALNVQLQDLNAQSQDSETFLQKQKISNSISQLIREASDKQAWHYGPLNERKMIKVEVPGSSPRPVDLSIQPEVIDFNDAPPFTNDLDNDPDEAPYIDESQLLDKNPLDDSNSDPFINPDPPEQKGNKFTKWVKKVANNFTKDVKGWDEYLTRNRGEMHDLAAYAGIAGIVSVSTAAVAAEVALALAAPPLLIPLAAIAAGGLINYFGFTKEVSKWANKKYDKTVASRAPEDTTEYRDFIEKAKLDKKYRMRTFAWADIVAKLAGGITLANILHPNVGASSGVDHTVAPQDGIHGPTPDHTVEHSFNPHDGGHGPTPDHTFPEPTSDMVPPQTEAAPGIPDLELPSGNFVEHVVTRPDEMLTQIVRDGLPGSENVYSANYIETLKANESTFIKMLQEMYPNGNVPHLTNTGERAFWSLEEAINNLKHVVDLGDPTLLPPEQQADAVNNMLQAITKIKPGINILIPQP